MRSTGSLSCSDFPHSQRVKLLGKQIAVKNYVCSPDGVNYRPKEGRIRLQLSIILSRYCDARCPFCIAAPGDDPRTLDMDVLKRALFRLREEDCVRGISVTGGEPFLHPEMLDRTVREIFGVFGYAMEVTLNTNGSGIERLADIRDLKHVDAVHISRHHWLDERNDAIFGRKMPSAREMRAAVSSLGMPDLFVLNCMLLRGEVETPADVHRYLDFSIDVGAGKAAFITATQVNEYTHLKRVPFEEALREDDESLLFTRRFWDHGYCRCRDGIYVSPGGRLIQFYGRHTESGGCPYCRGLVLTPEGDITAGFGGPALLRVT